MSPDWWLFLLHSQSAEPAVLLLLYLPGIGPTVHQHIVKYFSVCPFIGLHGHRRLPMVKAMFWFKYRLALGLVLAKCANKNSCYKT